MRAIRDVLVRLRDADPDGEVALRLGSGRQVSGQVLVVTERLVTVRGRPVPGAALEPATTLRIDSVVEVKRAT